MVTASTAALRTSTSRNPPLGVEAITSYASSSPVLYDRDERLLDDVDRHLGIAAAAAQPDFEPGRVAAVVLLERAPIAGRGGA